MVFGLLALSLAMAMNLYASEPSLKLKSIWNLGGDGSWDYMTVDPASHILYIARLNRIMLVDVQSGKLVTEITGLTHAHGIAFDDQGKLGYISDGGAGTILVFDRVSYKTLATLPAGKNPDAVLFEATQRRVFAFNGGSHDATVIDAATNSVISTIPLPGRPEFSVTDGAGNIFVSIENSSVVLRIDAATLKTTASWPLAPGVTPSVSPSIPRGIVSSRIASSHWFTLVNPFIPKESRYEMRSRPATTLPCPILATSLCRKGGRPRMQTSRRYRECDRAQYNGYAFHAARSVVSSKTGLVK